MDDRRLITRLAELAAKGGLTKRAFMGYGGMGYGMGGMGGYGGGMGGMGNPMAMMQQFRGQNDHYAAAMQAQALARQDALRKHEAEVHDQYQKARDAARNTSTGRTMFATDAYLAGLDKDRKIIDPTTGKETEPQFAANNGFAAGQAGFFGSSGDEGWKNWQKARDQYHTTYERYRKAKLDHDKQTQIEQEQAGKRQTQSEEFAKPMMGYAQQQAAAHAKMMQQMMEAKGNAAQASGQAIRARMGGGAPPAGGGMPPAPPAGGGAPPAPPGGFPVAQKTARPPGAPPAGEEHFASSSKTGFLDRMADMAMSKFTKDAAKISIKTPAKLKASPKPSPKKPAAPAEENSFETLRKSWLPTTLGTAGAVGAMGLAGGPEITRREREPGDPSGMETLGRAGLTGGVAGAGAGIGHVLLNKHLGMGGLALGALGGTMLGGRLSNAMFGGMKKDRDVERAQAALKPRPVPSLPHWAVVPTRNEYATRDPFHERLQMAERGAVAERPLQPNVGMGMPGGPYHGVDAYLPSKFASALLPTPPEMPIDELDAHMRALHPGRRKSFRKKKGPGVPVQEPASSTYKAAGFMDQLALKAASR